MMGTLVGAAVGAHANQPPVVDLNGPGAGIDNTAAYTEGAPAAQRRPLIATAGTISDDGTTPYNIYSMTVTLTNPLNGASESLSALTGGTTITTTGYDKTTGELYLRGGESVANFQQVLRTVRYANSSTNPNTTPRVITVVVQDFDGANSATATTTVSITATNNAPIAVVPTDGNGSAVTQNVTLNTPFVFSAGTNNQMGVADADDSGQPEEVSLSVLHGTLTLNGKAGLTFSQGTGTGDTSIVFRGTVTVAKDAQGNDIPGGAANAALDGLTYTPATGYTGPDTLTLGINDLGNTGVGGAKTASATAPLNVAAPVAPSALFSEFRLSGPGGLGDEFIELANATGASVDVSGWSVVAGGVTVPLSGVIAARGHLLLANAGGYSLGGAAPADLSYSGDIPTGSSLCLKNAGGTVVDTVSAPIASPASATDQYAYVRRLESGAPSNTGNTTTDFNLVDTSATSSTVGASGVGALGGARLGSPNPHNAASTVQRNDGISNKAMNIPGVYSIARYPSKGSAIDPQGRLSIRRTITNTTGASVSKLRFRIVGATSGGSTASGVADLRAISSGGVRYYDASHVIQRAAYGMTLDAPTTPTEAPLSAASSGNGGGLNAGWTVPLPGGTLAAGASVNVEFLFGIQAEGQFRIVVDAEVLP